MEPEFYEINGEMVPKYTGPVGSGPIMNDNLIAKKAYSIWNNQKSRTTNPKNPSFKNYGRKGIVVKYTSREFVSWFLHVFNPDTWKNVNVGRIDHSRDYDFVNIQLEEKSENSRERNRRVRAPRGTHRKGLRRPRSVKVYKFPEMALVAVCVSKAQAAEITGCSAGNIHKYCSGELRKTISNFTFRYA
jgi:hypothetical protein